MKKDLLPRITLDNIDAGYDDLRACQKVRGKMKSEYLTQVKNELPTVPYARFSNWSEEAIREGVKRKWLRDVKIHDEKNPAKKKNTPKKEETTPTSKKEKKALTIDSDASWSI